MVCVTTMTVMRERFNQKRVTIMLPCIMRVCERLLAEFHIGEGLGDVTLQLEKPHAGLIPYGNTITLLPLVTTELTQALEVVP